MKKFFALTVVFFALVGLMKIASAGPERLEAKEMVQPVVERNCNWTGFYIGIHGGWTDGQLTWKDTDFADSEILIHDNTDSPFVGGQLGYNHQFGSWLVLGAEGDFSWWDGGGRRSTSNLSGEEEETNTWATDSNWIGTFGLRAGVTSWNNRLLAYVKGGAAIEVGATTRDALKRQLSMGEQF